MASFRQKGKFWYYRYTNEVGKKCERKGHWDLVTTKGMAAAVETEVSKIRSGYIDAKAAACTRHDSRPLTEHLEDFKAALEAKGGSKRHPKVTCSRAKKILDLAKVKRISQLSNSIVMAAVATLREEGASTETINHYIRAVKAFSRWLWRDGRARDHYLAHLATSSPEADRRRVRRALSPEEASRVVQAAEHGPEAGGLTGADRAILYALALGTGFRAEELRTLTPERFALSANPPTATVLACYSKNGKVAVQPIAATLAERVRPWLASKSPGRPVFEGMTERTAEMLRVDLEAAKVPYETDSGVADFHALRAAYISNLVASGASVKVCQTLARHSTPSLTIGLYAKASLHDIKGAVENLPELAPPESGPDAVMLAATGTHGNQSSKKLAHHMPTAGTDSSRGLMDSDGIVDAIIPMTMVDPGLGQKGSDDSCRDGTQYRRWESNPHGRSRPEDFKSSASAIPPRRQFPTQQDPGKLGSKILGHATAGQPRQIPPGIWQNDPGLAVAMGDWGRLPEATHAGIAAAVQAAAPSRTATTDSSARGSRSGPTARPRAITKLGLVRCRVRLGRQAWHLLSIRQLMIYKTIHGTRLNTITIDL